MAFYEACHGFGLALNGRCRGAAPDLLCKIHSQVSALMPRIPATYVNNVPHRARGVVLELVWAALNWRAGGMMWAVGDNSKNSACLGVKDSSNCMRRLLWLRHRIGLSTKLGSVP